MSSCREVSCREVPHEPPRAFVRVMLSGASAPDRRGSCTRLQIVVRDFRARRINRLATNGQPVADVHLTCCSRVPGLELELTSELQSACRQNRIPAWDRGHGGLKPCRPVGIVDRQNDVGIQGIVNVEIQLQARP